MSYFFGEVQIEELKQVEVRFSDSIRSLALQGTDSLETAIALLVEDKKKANKEINELNDELNKIIEKEKSHKRGYEGHDLKRFLSMAFRDFDKMYDIEKKTLLQAVFSQILVHTTDDGVDLEIVTSLDPFQSPAPASSTRGKGEGFAKILKFPSIKNQKTEIKKGHFLSSKPVRGVEGTKWPFVVNDRGDRWHF